MDRRKVKSFAEKISPLKKSHKVASEIGSPTNFKHVVHIGTDSSHADVAEVPKKWQDLLDIAAICKELDIPLTGKDNNIEEDNKKIKEEIEERAKSMYFESDFDLYAELQSSLSDDYKKFLFG